MNFGKALELLKEGKKVDREGWNGKGMHVEKVTLQMLSGDLNFIDNPCLVLRNVQGKFNTWVPSITDLFAEDWQEVE